MGACIIMKITHGRYYYKFHETVEKLRREDNTCYICGSNKKVKPHHIRRVKESDPNMQRQIMLYYYVVIIMGNSINYMVQVKESTGIILKCMLKKNICKLLKN